MLLGKVLDNWERRKSDITWNDVIEMLISPAMKAKGKHIAENIKRDFKVCHTQLMATKSYNYYIISINIVLQVETSLV